MNPAVLSLGIVRPLLVLTTDQLDVDDVSERVDGRGRRLISCQQRVQLFDVRRREDSIATDKSEQSVDRLLVVMDHRGDAFGTLATSAVWYQRCIDTALDQDLRHSAIESVDALDETGLDRPFPLQTLTEAPQSFNPFELVPLLLPDVRQLPQLRFGERLRRHLVVLDRTPGIGGLLAHDEPSHRRPLDRQGREQEQAGPDLAGDFTG